MRILVMLTDLFDTIGGIQTFNRALVKTLDELAERNRWRCSVLVLNDQGTNPLAHHYMHPAYTYYRGFSGNRLRFATAGLLAGQKMDKVIIGHVHFSPLACGIVRASKHLVVHGVDVWRRLSVAQNLGVARINHILSVSRFTRDQMTKHNGTRLDRFSILPNTLDPYYNHWGFMRTRDDLGLPPGRMILSVSRLDATEHYKKVELVIQTMPAVLKEIPDAFYVLVGDGTDRPRLEQLARQAGVADKVFFVGRVSDALLPSYYQAADVFALPSLKEGFGIVFLEAMYYAKPCIGARAGGAPEVIDDGKTGVLVHPGDARSLTDSLIRLLGNDTLRQAMGQAGKQRLEQEFSFGMFRQRLEKVLCP